MRGGGVGARDVGDGSGLRLSTYFCKYLFICSKLKPSTSDKGLCDNHHPRHPLQYLVEAQPGPQAQVGPEEVKGVHEAELVHGGLPYPDLVIKIETDRRIAGKRHGRHLLPDGRRGTETG